MRKYFNYFVFHLPRKILWKKRWAVLVRPLNKPSSTPLEDKKYFLRHASIEDLERLLAIYPEDFSWYLPDWYMRKVLKRRFDRGIACFVLCDMRNDIVGACWCPEWHHRQIQPSGQENQRACEIASFFIIPEYRKRRISSQLLEYACLEMKAMGFDMMYSLVFYDRPASLKSHISSGFVGLGEKTIYRFLGKEWIKFSRKIDVGFLGMDPLPAAVLLGRSNPNMLAHLRALGRQNVPVYAILLRKDPAIVVKWSRYSTRVIEKFHASDEEVRDLLIAIARDLGSKSVLYCTNEVDVALLSRIWPDIRHHYHPTTNPARAVDLVDKRLQYSIAEQAGCWTPRTYYVSSKLELSKASANIRYPVICRPTRREKAGAFNKKVLLFDAQSDAVERLSPILERGDAELIFQEYVPGEDDRIYFYLSCNDSSGKPEAWVTGHKIRQYPVGAMASGRTCVNTALAELGGRYMESIGLSGIMGIEFKENSETGEFAFIEINVRAENFSAIAEAAGVNLIVLAHLTALGHGGKIATCSQLPVVWRDEVRDTVAALIKIWKKENSIAEVLMSLSGRRVSSSLAFDDPLPGLLWISVRLRDALLAVLRK